MNTKRINEKPFYYNHVINDFIVDTLHIDVEHKYAYLTLIWEAHRSRGILKPQTLDMVFKRNKDINIDTYWNVLNEFWKEDEDGSYSNDRVTTDLHKSLQHKESSVKGANTTNLKKMVDSDKRLDEFRQLNKMMPSVKNKRMAEPEGLALYCKQLQGDKRFTFYRVKRIIKSFERSDPQYIPALGVIFRDTDAKFWKLGNEFSTTEKAYMIFNVEQQVRDLGFTWKTVEERNAIPKFKELLKLTMEK